MKQLDLFPQLLTCYFGSPWPCGPCAQCLAYQGDEPTPKRRTK